MADPYKEFDATGRFAFNAHECDECKATTLHDLDDDCWGVSLDGQHALLLVRGNRMERGDRVVEWKGTPNRSIWSYNVGDDGSLSGKTKLIDAADQGSLDGFRVDRDGNLWCGWGSNGALQSEPTDVGGRKVYQLKGKSEDLDGVMVFSSEGKPLAFIKLPERCENLCFGGPKNNRLYMASCHSIYALYVEARGAV